MVSAYDGQNIPADVIRGKRKRRVVRIRPPTSATKKPAAEWASDSRPLDAGHRWHRPATSTGVGVVVGDGGSGAGAPRAYGSTVPSKTRESALTRSQPFVEYVEVAIGEADTCVNPMQ